MDMEERHIPRANYELQVIHGFLTAQSVGTLGPQTVQGSTVLLFPVLQMEKPKIRKVRELTHRGSTNNLTHDY